VFTNTTVCSQTTIVHHWHHCRFGYVRTYVRTGRRHDSTRCVLLVL